jgi:hypothetical protein
VKVAGLSNEPMPIRLFYLQNWAELGIHTEQKTAAGSEDPAARCLA